MSTVAARCNFASYNVDEHVQELLKLLENILNYIPCELVYKVTNIWTELNKKNTEGLTKIDINKIGDEKIVTEFLYNKIDTTKYRYTDIASRLDIYIHIFKNEIIEQLRNTSRFNPWKENRLRRIETCTDNELLPLDLVLIPTKDSYFSHTFYLFDKYGIEIPRDVFLYHTENIPPLNTGSLKTFRKQCIKYQKIMRYSYEFILTVYLWLKRSSIQSCRIYILQQLDYITYNCGTNDGISIMDSTNNFRLSSFYTQ